MKKVFAFGCILLLLLFIGCTENNPSGPADNTPGPQDQVTPPSNDGNPIAMLNACDYVSTSEIESAIGRKVISSLQRDFIVESKINGTECILNFELTHEENPAGYLEGTLKLSLFPITKWMHEDAELGKWVDLNDQFETIDELTDKSNGQYAYYYLKGDSSVTNFYMVQFLKGNYWGNIVVGGLKKITFFENEIEEKKGMTAVAESILSKLP